MLTQSELVWLRERELRTTPCAAELPRVICNYCIEMVGTVCPLKPDYRDAAEFEARVAVIAANGAQPCLVDDETPFLGGDCPEGKQHECERYNSCFVHCGLKHARLFVESVLDDVQNEDAHDK